jgi:hypothetical protein
VVAVLLLAARQGLPLVAGEKAFRRRCDARTASLLPVALLDGDVTLLHRRCRAPLENAITPLVLQDPCSWTHLEL